MMTPSQCLQLLELATAQHTAATTMSRLGVVASHVTGGESPPAPVADNVTGKVIFVSDLRAAATRAGVINRCTHMSSAV